MLWIERLNNHLSGFLTPPGAARHLGEEGKGRVGGGKIGQHEGDISRDDSNQRYSWQIESLGNHLCAHQYISLAVGETVEQLLVSAPVFGCVAIPAQQACRRKVACNSVFHLFGPQAKVAYAWAITLGAGVQHLRLPVAVVTEQDAFSRMIGQRHIAAAPHCHEATLAAYHPACTP